MGLRGHGRTDQVYSVKSAQRVGPNRRLSATGYVEWVLGDLPPKSAMHVITEIDPKSGALFARNPYNTEFRERTAFFDVDETTRTVSGDRTEFLGRNGRLRAPAAMSVSALSNKVGAALDPCAAIQVSFDLAPGQEREIVFRLGLGRDTEMPEIWSIAFEDRPRPAKLSIWCGSTGNIPLAR